MPGVPEVWAELAKELLAVVRDWRDPEKKKANFKLNLEKRAWKKLEYAEELIYCADQYVGKVNVVLLEGRAQLSADDKRFLETMAKQIEHYSTKFRKL